MENSEIWYSITRIGSSYEEQVNSRMQYRHRIMLSPNTNNFSNSYADIPWSRGLAPKEDA